VIFKNHKCYFADKVGKKTVAFGIEEHGIFKMVDAGDAKEYDLMAKSSQNSNKLWHQRYEYLNLRYLS
jgi:hypothetical protein